MIVTELTPILDSDLPIGELSQHLRLGTGFSEDGLQDGVLENHIRAALGAIEAQLGITIIARDFSWDVTKLTETGQQRLPLRPVTAFKRIRIYRNAQKTATLEEGFSVRSNLYDATLIGPFPRLGAEETALIEFRAGFGAWASVPADLRQAVILLASFFYENRAATGGFPHAIKALLAPYRERRISLGASL